MTLVLVVWLILSAKLHRVPDLGPTDVRCGTVWTTTLLVVCVVPTVTASVVPCTGPVSCKTAWTERVGGYGVCW